MHRAKPLKSIVMDPETKEITIKPAELIQEAEDRITQPGYPSREDQFMNRTGRVKRRYGWWPEDKKIEVASLYAAGVVSSKDLSKLTGVPDSRIREWRLSEWWPEMLEKIHAEIDKDTVSKFTDIVDTALEVIQDRLVNGDHIYDKRTGEIHRKAVSMRDANVVAATIVDKRQLLRGKPTSRSEKVSVDARLGKLAEEFARFAAAKEITLEAKETRLEG